VKLPSIMIFMPLLKCFSATVSLDQNRSFYLNSVTGKESNNLMKTMELSNLYR